MRVNVSDAMTALFSGKDYTNRSIQTRQRGEWNDTAPGWHMPTVYSYGDHYPLVMLNEGMGMYLAYVNTRKVSVTTSTQQSGAAEYLATIAGYRNTGQTVELGYDSMTTYKCQYEIWEKVDDDPRYTGPRYHPDSRTYGPRQEGN